MEYKYIKKFLPELNILDHVQPAAIIASDLEAELAKGVEVFGDDEDITNTAFTTSKVEGVDTHSGLLLNYKPLEPSEPVSREELKTYLMGYEIGLPSKAHEILKRILENGVK